MKKTVNYLEKLLKKEDKVIISCSSGPDSMCLFNILLKLKEDIGFNIICAHVNHTRRKASFKEEKFLKEYCKKNNVIFESIKLEKFKDNFQQDARNKRFVFLKELSKKYKANYIMTAHHGDDLVETILMRISRGSNLRGYSGFKIKNDEFIKPLIFYTKEKILKYNKINNVPFKIDKSNKSLRYTRNRYRHKVLNNLKKENNNIHSKYLKFSEELIKYDNYIRHLIETKLIVKNYKLDINLFNKENDFIKERIIEHFLSLYQDKFVLNVTDNTTLEILKVINSNKQRTTIDLADGFIGIKEDKMFYLKKGI